MNRLRTSVALGLALLGFSLAGAAAGAQSPPPFGTIVYDDSAQTGGATTESSCTGDPSIETIGAEGGPSTTLAEGSDPAYSPDGTEIVFSLCDGIQSDLMVMNSDGSDPRSLTSTPKVSETEPAFSADGSRIFYSHDPDSEGPSQIYSIGVDGTGRRQLTRSRGETVGSRPAAAPNGRYVVFNRGGELLTIRPNGSHPKKLTRGWDAAVSPDSRRVVYSFRRQLWSIGPAGGHRHRLTHLSDPSYRSISAVSPSISPDGHWVVFALEQTDSLAPGNSSSEKLDQLSLATGEVVTLTTTSVGGFYPDWQPHRG